MLSLIWWMYAGYSWLTNAVTPDRTTYRLALLGGMACWLVISLAIPGAFSGDGEVFAAAYIVVILIHAGLFTRATGSAAIAILRVARFNLTAGALMLAGALTAEEPLQYLLWALAIAAIWATPRLGGAFNLRASHFVERHGLVVIVALGESVVATGIGASAHPISVELLAVAVLGLAVSACLWWAHFVSEDDEAPVRAMAATPPERQATVALNAFYYAHLLILLGIVAIAAALEEAIAHPFDPLSLGLALALGAGAAAYLCGEVLFKRALRLPYSGWLLAAALLSAATIPLGTGLSALPQLAALVVVLTGCLIASAPRASASPQRAAA